MKFLQININSTVILPEDFVDNLYLEQRCLMKYEMSLLYITIAYLSIPVKTKSLLLIVYPPVLNRVCNESINVFGAIFHVTISNL